MNKEYYTYKETLEELLGLLSKYKEDNWVKYFSKSKSLLDEGKTQKSIFHSLGAYGGMCSFNDALSFNGAPPVDSERGFKLREILWQQCKMKQSFFKRIIE